MAVMPNNIKLVCLKLSFKITLVIIGNSIIINKFTTIVDRIVRPMTAGILTNIN